MESISAIIMAAGKDCRMKSKKSKFAQMLYGKPVIQRTVEAVQKAGIQDVFVVVGENQEEIQEILKDEVTYIHQEKCLGSGHAIMQSVEYLKKMQGKVIVMNGNKPLVQPETIEDLAKEAVEEGNAATVLTGMIENPYGYGRIIRQGSFLAEVVEEQDATEEQRKIHEVNAGVYCFDAKELSAIITRLTANSMGLYWITDVIKMMSAQGKKIATLVVEDKTEILSLNTKAQLEVLARILRMRNNQKHLENGVTIEDSQTTYIYDDVEIGMDTVIHPNTTIKSGVVIGEDCEIGPNAYIREGCHLANKVKIGSFVEIKKAIIDEGSKVPHLSYMGDCKIGKKCNIGCGTITCNYDGKNKFKTKIGDHSFIGSNTNLIAPVTLGNETFVAAGSTITEDIPDYGFGIARQRQTIKENWKKKEQK